METQQRPAHTLQNHFRQYLVQAADNEGFLSVGALSYSAAEKTRVCASEISDLSNQLVSPPPYLSTISTKGKPTQSSALSLHDHPLKMLYFIFNLNRSETPLLQQLLTLSGTTCLLRHIAPLLLLAVFGLPEQCG
jgi:hypothetical protein